MSCSQPAEFSNKQPHQLPSPHSAFMRLRSLRSTSQATLSASPLAVPPPPYSPSLWASHRARCSTPVLSSLSTFSLVNPVPSHGVSITSVLTALHPTPVSTPDLAPAACSYILHALSGLPAWPGSWHLKLTLGQTELTDCPSQTLSSSPILQSSLASRLTLRGHFPS